jgi:hypothetical protein
MGLPYVKHSETSKAAAQALVNPGTKRAAVLRFIESRGREGATDDEIQVGLGMSPSTERPRRIELFEARLIVKNGVQRYTRAGRLAEVYMATSCIAVGDRVEFAPVEKVRCPHCNRPF